MLHELGHVRVMDSSIIALIFVAVFGGIAILYCLFRVLGGRIADCLSCNFCRGPCCDCWGAGGRADAGDFDVVGYPRVYAPGYQGGGYLPPLSGLDRQRQPQQVQPIVIVNRTDGGSSSSDTSSDSDSDDDAYTQSKRSKNAKKNRENREAKRQRAEAAVYTRNGREYDPLREQSGLGGGPYGGVVVV